MNKKHLSLVVLVVVLSLAGCRGVDEEENQTTPIPGSEAQVSHARLDLSQRTGLDSSDIELVSVQAVNFNDTSLGVTRPGEVYAPVITPGYVIQLEAADQVYQYHTDKEDRLVIYQITVTSTTSVSNTTSTLTETVFPVIPGEIMDGKPWMPAD
jgi:hypothetical protein